MRTAIAIHSKAFCFALTPARLQGKECCRGSVSVRSAAEWKGSLASGGRALEGKNRQVMMLCWRASTRGFSRVELMVVAAVMLVLAAIAIPRVSGVVQTYRAGADARSIASQLTLARTSAGAQNTDGRMNLNGC